MVIFQVNPVYLRGVKPVERLAIRTYGDNRYCECGAKISIYHKGNKCYVCKDKEIEKETARGYAVERKGFVNWEVEV